MKLLEIISPSKYYLEPSNPFGLTNINIKPPSFSVIFKAVEWVSFGG